jgi:hypothetical protein
MYQGGTGKMKKQQTSLVTIDMIGSIYGADGWVPGARRKIIVDADDSRAVLRACYGDASSLVYGQFCADTIVSVVPVGF